MIALVVSVAQLNEYGEPAHDFDRLFGLGDERFAIDVQHRFRKIGPLGRSNGQVRFLISIARFEQVAQRRIDEIAIWFDRNRIGHIAIGIDDERILDFVNELYTEAIFGIRELRIERHAIDDVIARSRLARYRSHVIGQTIAPWRYPRQRATIAILIVVAVGFCHLQRYGDGDDEHQKPRKYHEKDEVMMRRLIRRHALTSHLFFQFEQWRIDQERRLLMPHGLEPRLGRFLNFLRQFLLRFIRSTVCFASFRIE